MYEIMIANSCTSFRFTTDIIYSLECKQTSGIGRIEGKMEMVLKCSVSGETITRITNLLPKSMFLIGWGTSMTLDNPDNFLLELSIIPEDLVFYRKIPYNEIESVKLLYELGEENTQDGSNFKKLTTESWKDILYGK